MKKLIIGIAALFLVCNAFALGLIQDYPSSFDMKPGDSFIYGIRITNDYADSSYIDTSTYGQIVGFTIDKLSKDDITQIYNPKALYTLKAGERQRLFINITIPKDNYKDTYTIEYKFNEKVIDSPDTMIDTALSKISRINIRVTYDPKILPAITHTQNEIDSMSSPERIKSMETIPEKKTIETSEDVALADTKTEAIQGTSYPETKQEVSSDTPKKKVISTVMTVTEKPMDMTPFYIGGAVLLTLGGVGAFNMYKGRTSNKPTDKSNKSILSEPVISTEENKTIQEEPHKRLYED